MGIPAPQGVAASGIPPQGDQANAVLSGTITGVGPTQPFAFRGPMNLAIWASIVTALTTTAASLAATVASATGLAAGASINSVKVPKGTTVGVLSGTNVTLAPPTLTFPGRVSVSAARITDLPRTAGLVGSTVTGPGIPAATTVTAVLVAAIAPTNDSGGQPGIVQISALPTSAAADNAPQQFFTFTGVAGEITTTGADAAASFTGAGVTFSATINIERSFDGCATWVPCNFGSGTLAQVNAGTPFDVTFGEPEKQVFYRLNCIIYTSGTINYRISQTGGAAESLAIGPLSGG